MLMWNTGWPEPQGESAVLFSLLTPPQASARCWVKPVWVCYGPDGEGAGGLCSLHHIPLPGCMWASRVCVCALLCVGDIFLLRSSFVRTCVCQCVCDKPPAWGLLSSPSFPSYISSGGASQAWAAGSPCWRPLELTVWEEQLEKAASPWVSTRLETLRTSSPSAPECPFLEDWFLLSVGCLPGTTVCFLSARSC